MLRSPGSNPCGLLFIFESSSQSFCARDNDWQEEIALQSSSSHMVSHWYGPKHVAIADPNGPKGSGLFGWAADFHFRQAVTGKVEIRPAYYERGKWHANLVARTAGRYKVELRVSQIGRPSRTLQAGDVNLPVALPHGFIRRSKQNVQRLIHDDGTPYTPIGLNVAWQNKGEPSYASTLKTMAENGVNWTRIWACHWDGKNPWWPEPKTVSHNLDVMWQPALDRWTEILSAAERNKVGVQLVLFHHGQVTTEVNPNWKDHPWNEANGGWLKNPAEFFTDPEAIRRSKVWLREAVARFGHLQSILAWELFNEVEWVDAARKEHRWDLVTKWHAEMARYIRSIDAYAHLITTSSAVDHRALWNEMDIIEPHTYPANIRVAVSAVNFSEFRKPGMFGEFGPTNGSSRNAKVDIQDGIFAGLIANHAGAGQYWYWDTVQKQQLYAVFKRARDIVDISNWWAHPKAKSVAVKVVAQSSPPGNLDCTPAIGWGQSDVTEFFLPDDVNAGALGKCSSYLQGAANRKMQPRPITFRFTAAVPGKITVVFDEISKSGASVRINLDGNIVLSKSWNASVSDIKLEERMTITISAGEHVLMLENTGADWAHLKEVTLPGVAPAMRGRGLVERGWGLFTLEGSTDVTVDWVPGLPDASYRAEFWDLVTDSKHTQRIIVFKGNVLGFKNPFARSVMLMSN